MGLLSRRLTVAVVTLLTVVALGPVRAQQRDDRDQDRDHREGGPNRPIQVDCTAGESLARALQMFPERTDQITIQIHGFCQEAVDITRKVIIQGTDPQIDGISGPASLGNRTAMVVVYGVNGFGLTGSESVRLENLTVMGSPNIGVSVDNAQLGLTNVVIRDNSGIGMVIFPLGSGYAMNVIVQDNHRTGVLTASGSFNCVSCTLTNNGPTEWQANVNGAGRATFTNTTMTGNKGVASSQAGQMNVYGGSIAAANRAAEITNGGQVFFQGDAMLTGALFCSTQGVLDSRKGAGSNGFTQLSNAGGGNNAILNGCVFLAASGTTTLSGSTTVGAGSITATENGNSAIVRFNALTCSNGGKVTTTSGQIFVNSVLGIPASCQ